MMHGVTGQPKAITAREAKARQAPKLPKVSTAHTKKSAGKKVTTTRAQAASSANAPTAVSTTGISVTELPPSRSKTEIAKERLALPPHSTGDTGHAKVKFNHYNKHFPVHNGVLKWADIDEEYCISFVYRGDFGRNLHALPTAEDQLAPHPELDELNLYYLGVRDKGEYRLEIVEDPVAGIGAEGLRLNCGPIRADSLAAITACSMQSTSRAMDDITTELKAMKVSELNGAHAKDLLERRDLEDILYSGSSDVTTDEAPIPP